ncbi:MAG: YaaL family protein [Defluviitaleaceae bacterium]|nr:YaaL family protein [Defluviitaleaceae bacterium]
MTNLTQSVAYAPEATVWEGLTVLPEIKKATGGGRKVARPSKSKRLTREDMEIVAALEAVRSDMEFLHNCFDHTTDAILIDSLIYELKAANLKYKYYLSLCKEKGIVGGMLS